MGRWDNLEGLTSAVVMAREAPTSCAFPLKRGLQPGKKHAKYDKKKRRQPCANAPVCENLRKEHSITGLCWECFKKLKEDRVSRAPVLFAEGECKWQF